MNEQDWKHINEDVANMEQAMSGDVLALQGDLLKAVQAPGGNNLIVLHNEIAALKMENAGQQAFIAEVRAQRDYYAGLVDEAREIVDGLYESIHAGSINSALVMMSIHGMGGYDEELVKLIERARAWLKRPTAWNRKDGDNG